MNGRQPGDPAKAAKAAKAILAIAEAESPSLRLVLGKYAIKKARDKSAALLRDVEASESLAGAVEFTA